MKFSSSSGTKGTTVKNKFEEFRENPVRCRPKSEAIWISWLNSRVNTPNYEKDFAVKKNS